MNLKFEVKENFAKFPRFLFWTYGKIKNSETLEVSLFSTLRTERT